MNGGTVVAIIGVLLALVLATRGVRAHGLSRRNALMMVLTWIAIIAALAFIFQRSGVADAM